MPYYRRINPPAIEQYGWPRTVSAATTPDRAYRPGTVTPREDDACCLPYAGMGIGEQETKRTAPYAGQSFRADLDDDVI